MMYFVFSDVQEGLWMPVSSKLRQNVDDSSLPVSQPMVDHMEDIPAQELSSLRLENQLLRSETTSLNQEMATLVNSNKHLHDGLLKCFFLLLFFLSCVGLVL